MGKAVPPVHTHSEQTAASAPFPANLVSGRGAASNPEARFEREQRQLEDDGWGLLEELPPLTTQCQNEVSRSIITRNTSPDLPFDRSINPYRGCEHGCTYCFARPSHAYMGLSPGLDFETRLYAKGNAAEVLERDLSKPSYKPKPIAMGTNTDPYQPIERTHQLMRQILEVLERCGHPVSIITKSALILRDKDILARLAERNLVSVRLSVTTEDRHLARSMEPRASTPANRFKAIEALAAAGVPTGVMVAPVIPGLTDHELEGILTHAKDAGASAATYILLRMPREVSELFKDWLLREAPGRYRHVLSLMRSMRGGKDYDPQWNRRFRGDGPYADQLSRRFQLACRRLELSTRGGKLSTEHFVPPQKGGVQLSLF